MNNSVKKKKRVPAKAHPPLKLASASLDDLEHAELSGVEDKSPSTEASETDDDENEGVGDGSIGRTVKGEI